jgi:hypothetical protein
MFWYSKHVSFHFSAIDCDVDHISSHKQFPRSYSTASNKVLEQKGK